MTMTTPSYRLKEVAESVVLVVAVGIVVVLLLLLAALDDITLLECMDCRGLLVSACSDWACTRSFSSPVESSESGKLVILCVT